MTFIEQLGRNGVYLFFVLSGFLITYLLLKEKNEKGKILLIKFWLRRLFRIWPLYYITVFISFVLIPILFKQFGFFSNSELYLGRIGNVNNYGLYPLLLYLFFLPNLALIKGYLVVGASQSWSVGVEEQFYIVWPILLIIFKRFNLLLSFVTIVMIFLFINMYPVYGFLKSIAKVVPFEFMAIGAIGGYFYFYQHEKIDIITNSRLIYLLIILLSFFSLFFSFRPHYFYTVIQGLLFIIMIICTVNKKNNFRFENKYFSYFGKISYGIYMYHPLAMFLVMPLTLEYISPSEDLAIYNILIYILITTITLGISHISYNFFEKYFISFKDKNLKAL